MLSPLCADRNQNCHPVNHLCAWSLCRTLILSYNVDVPAQTIEVRAEGPSTVRASHISRAIVEASGGASVVVLSTNSVTTNVTVAVAINLVESSVHVFVSVYVDDVVVALRFESIVVELGLVS